VLVLSTGVIGVPLPMSKLLPGVKQAVAALSPTGGGDAARAIMTTDTKPKEASVSTTGFTVGGMAKGAGMIHPDLATMLAILTTDYPLASGEPIGFLRPAVDDTFNAISIDGDCSTNDTVLLFANGASGLERTAETDAAFAAALHAVCDDLSRQVVADGEGVTVLAEINVTGAVDDSQAKAIARRIATSPLVKTALFGHDANWGRVLMAAGSAPHNGGYAEVDAGRVTLSYNGTVVLERGEPRLVEPEVSGPAELHDRPRSRARRRRGELPDERPLLRLRPHQRGLQNMSRLVIKVGGNAALVAATHDLVGELVASHHEVTVVHGAGPQISGEMERRGIPVEFVRGRRVTTSAALEVVRESLVAVNASLCEAIGSRAVGLLGDEIGLRATPVPELGLVGDALASCPPAIEAALAEGLIPVVAPLAEGPLNVNADDAAAALAVGLGADRVLFISDVPGLLLAGAVVEAIRTRDAEDLLDAGALDGGIVPKLRAAITAARLGVRAEIGETVVVA
jgi:acetylglutamate kinase